MGAILELKAVIDGGGYFFTYMLVALRVSYLLSEKSHYTQSVTRRNTNPRLAGPRPWRFRSVAGRWRTNM